MNRRHEWEKILSIANDDLKQRGYEILVTEPEDGFFSCYIRKGGDEPELEEYAENYYEDELDELVNEAWHYAKAKKPVKDPDYQAFTKDQVDGIECEVHAILRNIFTDTRDRSQVVDAILNDVMSDIEETADWSGLPDDGYCLDDIQIAVARALKQRICGE